MLLSAIPLAVVVTPARQPSQEGSRNAAEVASVLTDLIDQSTRMKSFVAEYRLVKDDPSKVGRLRVVLDRGDRLKLEASIAGESVSFWYIDGTFAYRVLSEGGVRRKADVRQMGQIIGAERKLLAQLQADFPTRDSSTGPLPEARPYLQCSFDKDATPGSQFHLTVGIATVRSMLGWLEWLKAQNLACTEKGDTLTFDLGGDTHLDLSKASGFITSIRSSTDGKETQHLALEKLDLEPEISAREFEVPTSKEGFVDESTGFMEGMASQFMLMDFRSICKRTNRLIADEAAEWNDTNRGKVDRLMALVHDDRVGLAYTSWSEKTLEWIEQRGASMDQKYADVAGDDHEWLRALDDRVKQGRSSFQASLTQVAEHYSQRYTIDPAVVYSADLRSDLEEKSRAAALHAFETELTGPILQRFDERMKEAREFAPKESTPPR
jgi:hypothetical protein